MYINSNEEYDAKILCMNAVRALIPDDGKTFMYDEGRLFADAFEKNPQTGRYRWTAKYANEAVATREDLAALLKPFMLFPQALRQIARQSRVILHWCPYAVGDIVDLRWGDGYPVDVRAGAADQAATEGIAAGKLSEYEYGDGGQVENDRRIVFRPADAIFAYSRWWCDDLMDYLAGDDLCGQAQTLMADVESLKGVSSKGWVTPLLIDYEDACLIEPAGWDKIREPHRLIQIVKERSAVQRGSGLE